MIWRVLAGAVALFTIAGCGDGIGGGEADQSPESLRARGGTRIFLYGDSIRIGYEQALRELLMGDKVWSPGLMNGHSSREMVQFFEDSSRYYYIDLFVINAGIHDRRLMVSLPEYQRNILKVIDLLLDETNLPDDAPKDKEIILLTSTKDTTEMYNEWLRTETFPKNVRVLDLYVFAQHLERKDNLHFDEENSAILAREIYRDIRHLSH